MHVVFIKWEQDHRASGMIYASLKDDIEFKTDNKQKVKKKTERQKN